MIDELRRWAVSPLVGERYVRDVPVAPEALASRLRTVISTKPKRMLGVLKVTSEWVGSVSGNNFVVFERRQHATRATGRIVGRRGGSRVDARISLTWRTQILAVVFFALFAFGSFGLLTRGSGLGFDPAGFAVAGAGALATLIFFWSASLRQHAALRALLDEVFREREEA